MQNFGQIFKRFAFFKEKKRVNFRKILLQSAWNLEDFEKIGDSLEFFLKNWPKIGQILQTFC